MVWTQFGLQSHFNMRDRYVTFVNYTKRQRLPKVLERAAKNLGSEGRRAEMLALLDNEDAVIDDSSWWPEGWGDWVRRLSGATVGQLNFFDYEFWFYAKILELSGYEKSPVDPFFMESAWIPGPPLPPSSKRRSGPSTSTRPCAEA